MRSAGTLTTAARVSKEVGNTLERSASFCRQRSSEDDENDAEEQLKNNWPSTR